MGEKKPKNEGIKIENLEQKVDVLISLIVRDINDIWHKGNDSYEDKCKYCERVLALNFGSFYGAISGRLFTEKIFHTILGTLEAHQCGQVIFIIREVYFYSISRITSRVKNPHNPKETQGPILSRIGDGDSWDVEVKKRLMQGLQEFSL